MRDYVLSLVCILMILCVCLSVWLRGPLLRGVTTNSYDAKVLVSQFCEIESHSKNGWNV